MERLTDWYKGRSPYYPYCFEKCDGAGSSKKCNKCEFSENICKRLAAYEDTGLTPEQIIEMDRLYSEMAKELGKCKNKLNNVMDYLNKNKL